MVSGHSLPWHPTVSGQSSALSRFVWAARCLPLPCRVTQWLHTCCTVLQRAGDQAQPLLLLSPLHAAACHLRLVRDSLHTALLFQSYRSADTLSLSCMSALTTIYMQ